MPDSSMRAAPSLTRDAERITTDFDRTVYCVLGLPFDALTLDALTDRVRRMPHPGNPCLLSTPNVNFVIGSRRNRSLRDSVLQSDLSILDGMPLLWIAKLLRIPIPERAAGSDLFERLQRSVGTPVSVFFFGGNDGVAERACAAVNARAGGMVCKGYHAPGHGTIEQMSTVEIVSAINDSRADFLVVALGAVKGQAWIVHNLRRLEVPLVCHLGAVINFLAGNVKRAPKAMQRTGLEWLWRIKEEPGLWRRYAEDGRTLLELLVTRVLPALGHDIRRGLTRGRLTAPHVSIIREETGCRISMSGDWSAPSTGPLRRALSEATTSTSPIVLDLSEAASVDSATVALLLLLKGHQIKVGERFHVLPMPAAVEQQLYLMGAEYLHESM